MTGNSHRKLNTSSQTHMQSKTTYTEDNTHTHDFACDFYWLAIGIERNPQPSFLLSLAVFLCYL